MYSQPAYPSFTLNHGIIQDGFGGYHHPSQAFYFPAVRPDGGDLGEHQAQVMTWNHAPQPEHPGHLNLCTPPGHQLREETPCVVESRKVKEESEDSNGSVEEKSHSVPQYYTHAWTPAFWPGSPSLSSQTQENASVPGSSVYPMLPPNQSPNTPETAAANVESSRCSSTPTQEVAKESNSPASQTVTSPVGQEEILSEDGEDTLEMPSEMEMEQFARDLKQKRVSLGFTQADVGYALGVLYEKMFSQTTICRFESLQLSYKNMCQLKPLLTRWLREAERNENLQELVNQEQVLIQSRKRKRRTNIENIAKDNLEIYFMKNPKPGPQEMEQIARHLHMAKDVVRVWFCNRRQKDKRQIIKEPHNEGYDPQHIVPHVGVFSHQEMPSPGYMFGSPPMYNPTFNHKNLFQQPVPHGMQLGNHIC
uniref:POU domain protein n=1 Tax=Aquarana catesbeiana TaxID=8400 RepID=C1C4W5_AQUCT|nr:POU domain, class 5, transcription factor 1 [Aquarana catesbeiana]